MPILASSPTACGSRITSILRRRSYGSQSGRGLVLIVLGVPIEKINVVCHFLGGGFGGKAYVWPHTLLTALAARTLNRPVCTQLTRAQMYSMVGHQAATIQTISLGADKDGKLTGIR